MRKRIYIFQFVLIWAVTAVFCWLSGLQAADTGTITGRVTDEVTGQPLPGANIVLENTLLGAGTDDAGRFIVARIPAGTYNIRISFIGYAPQSISVTIGSGSEPNFNVSLKPSALLFDQVIVTGSRQTEDLSQAVNSVDVLPSLEVLRRNYLRTNDALQELPSVDQLGDNVSVRGGSGYSFLGVGGSRVLMLIDDVPMLTSDFGRANWDFLPVTELERVEVLKGAASVLYGSGGISGVVNLISRRPTLKPHVAFRTSTGIYSDPSVPEWKWTDRNLYFYRTDFSYSQTFGPVGLRFSVSKHYDTGYRENSDVNRWYFTARPVIHFGDGSQLSLFLAYNKEDRGLFFLWKSQNQALNTDFYDRAKFNGLLVSAVYKKPFSSTFMTITRFSLNSQLVGLPLSLQAGFDPALGFSGEFRGIWILKNRHSLTFGMDYKHDIAASGFYGDHQANTYSPYLQDTWKVTSFLQLNAGVRYDSYSLVGGDSAETQFSPKFGLSFQPFGSTILHTSIGKGFRVPSIAEKFTEHDLQDAAQLTKNPALQPESATLFDIGLRQGIGNKFSAEISGFVSDYRNLISLTQTSDLNLILQFNNCEHARIQGIESQIKLKFLNNHLNLLANGTWMHSESLVDDPVCKIGKGEPLPYRPRFSAFFSPSVTVGSFTFESEYRYISRFQRVSFFLNEPRVALKVLNLRARFHWRQFILLMQVRNAINHNHTVVEQNIGEIRNFSFSISGEF